MWSDQLSGLQLRLRFDPVRSEGRSGPRRFWLSSIHLGGPKRRVHCAVSDWTSPVPFQHGQPVHLPHILSVLGHHHDNLEGKIACCESEKACAGLKHSSRIPKLQTEYYYQCLLEFEFLTPLACGGNAVHYRCDSESYQCVQDDSGRFESWADCSSGCVAPTTPPPTSCSGDACFACTSSFQCEASEYGHFTSQEACSSMCSPWVARYSCWGGRCVRNTRGNFTSEADCVTACAPTTASASDVHKTENRWSCSQGICTENGATGEFGSEADCESSCGSLDGNVEPVADV